MGCYDHETQDTIPTFNGWPSNGFGSISDKHAIFLKVGGK